MDYLLNIAGRYMIVLVAVITCIVVVLATYSLLTVVGTRLDPLRRRLKGLGQEDAASTTRANSDLLSAIRPLGQYLLPQKEKERETLRLQLIRAGFRSEAAAINLYALKFILIVVSPAVVCVLLLNYFDLHPAYVAFFGALAAFVGMMLPNIYLRYRIASRQKEMMDALPDALDLLVSCTQAGLGLNGAMQRVARQMSISSPLLALELEQVNAEIRGGVDRIVALRNLGERTGLREIRGLVSLLSQSMRFGSPIAEILRIYSEEFRDRRTQYAEEQAALIGTKLIFPLVFCIFPSFFVVSVGPAVVGVVRAMSGVHFGS